MDIRRPIAALLSSLVILISQSAGATDCYVYNKFEALCQFNTLERCSHRTLFSSDPAYADAGRDRSTDEVAPRRDQIAHQSKWKLARGGPLHVYHSSAGKVEHEAAQPAQRKKK
jgi:hypothetical protein